MKYKYKQVALWNEIMREVMQLIFRHHKQDSSILVNGHLHQIL